jgi:hypothetical protein
MVRFGARSLCTYLLASSLEWIPKTEHNPTVIGRVSVRHLALYVDDDADDRHKNGIRWFVHEHARCRDCVAVGEHTVVQEFSCATEVQY